MPSISCLFCGSNAASVALDAEVACYVGTAPPFCCEALEHAPVSVSRDGRVAYCPCCDSAGVHPLDPDVRPICFDNAEPITCEEDQDDENRCRHRGPHVPVALRCALCGGLEIALTADIPAAWLNL